MPSGQIELASRDIPQADSLESIRQIVLTISSGATTSLEIEKATGVSDRHVRYRLQTAKILGLVTDKLALTPIARKLIQAEPGSKDEKGVWRKAISNSKVFLLVPTLFQDKTLDKDSIAKKLARAANLSPATAERRARALRSWGNQLRIEEKKGDGEG